MENKQHEIFKGVYYERWTINLLQKVWQHAQKHLHTNEKSGIP